MSYNAKEIQERAFWDKIFEITFLDELGEHITASLSVTTAGEAARKAVEMRRKFFGEL